MGKENAIISVIKQNAILLLSIFTILLLGIIFFLHSPLYNSESVPGSKEIRQEEATSGWTTYENETYGFSVRYPNNLDVTPEEANVKLQLKQYNDDCARHLEGCGGSRWEDYRIAFVKPDGKAAFGVHIFTNTGEYLSDIANSRFNGFTYYVTNYSLVGQYPRYDKSVSEALLTEIQMTIKPIKSTKPLACLWSDTYEITDSKSLNPEIRQDAYATSGYFNNQENNTCEQITVYSWKDGTKNSPPFTTIQECNNACQ